TIRYTSGGRLIWNPALRRFLYNEIGGIRIPPKLVPGPVGGGHSSPHRSPTPHEGPEGAPGPKGGPRPPPPPGGGAAGGGASGGGEPPSTPFTKTEPASPESQLGMDKTAPDPASPQTPLDPQAELQEAAAEAEAAGAENGQATGDWLRYRINKPNPN